MKTAGSRGATLATLAVGRRRRCYQRGAAVKLVRSSQVERLLRCHLRREPPVSRRPRRGRTRYGDRCLLRPPRPSCRSQVRLHIIRNARIENVGKSQSCMFSTADGNGDLAWETSLDQWQPSGDAEVRADIIGHARINM